MALSEMKHHTSRGQRKDRAGGEARVALHGHVPDAPLPQGRILRHDGGHLPVPALDVPVPQMVDQPVDILKIIAMLSPAVEEQVIDVRKIIQDPTPQRLKPPEPQQLVEPGGSASAPCPRGHGLCTVRGHCWPHVDLHLRARWEIRVVSGGFTARPVDPPGRAHRQPRAVYKYWARMRISTASCTCSYLFGVGLPEEYLCGFFLGDDFWIYFRVQRFLVRQWIHDSSSLRRLFSRILWSILVLLSFCVRIQRNAWFDRGYKSASVYGDVHVFLCENVDYGS